MTNICMSFTHSNVGLRKTGQAYYQSFTIPRKSPIDEKNYEDYRGDASNISNQNLEMRRCYLPAKRDWLSQGSESQGQVSFVHHIR